MLRSNSRSSNRRLSNRHSLAGAAGHPASVFEPLEIRQLMASDVRAFDGVGNNLSHPQWGSTNQPLLRLAAAQYADGKSAPAGATRASARAISNAVDVQGAVDMPNSRQMSSFVYVWGQFIDHDLDLTNAATPAESFNIAVPSTDGYFDPAGTGTQVIPLTRSEYLAGTGVNGPRQQISEVTSLIDGSMVYGSDSARAAALRSGVGGQMKTSDGNLLPFNTMGLANAAFGAPENSFVAGDIRVNENVDLLAIQTLFVREHNRLASNIAKQNPALTDEQIFQRARKLVISEIQSITYNEFLPALLGPNALSRYAGYKPNVNPGIASEFSTAAFRIGHTLVSDDIGFLDNNGQDTRPEVSLAEAFFNPALVEQNGIDPILKYLASTNTQEVDTKVVDSLRNFLFGAPGQGGLDLASLNIQRGRDHGLADYNSTRAALGLPRVTSFAQITSDVTLQQQLQSVYGDVNSVDLWVGGLAENHLPGSSVGPTFQRIIVDQFTRVRDGDRFWYQQNLSPEDMQLIQGSKLVDIVRRNSEIKNLQDDVFTFNVEITGRVWNDANGDTRPQQEEPGLGGRRVTLLDDANAVIETAQTSMDGSYHFSNVALGHYHMMAESRPGWLFTTPPPMALAVTRGMRFDHVDFGQRQVLPQQPPPLPPVHDGPIARNPATRPPRMIDQMV